MRTTRCVCEPSRDDAEDKGDAETAAEAKTESSGDEDATDLDSNVATARDQHTRRPLGQLEEVVRDNPEIRPGDVGNDGPTAGRDDHASCRD